MAIIDIFMIIFIWVWGQLAPVALKVILTVVLVISAILRCAIDFLLANN